MGGEMEFEHNIEQPITDLALYKEIVDSIRSNKNFDIVENPITTWKNTDIRTDIVVNGVEWVSKNDDDYAFGIDLKKSRFYPASKRHYFMLFPKNPNTHRVISELHCRGMNFDHTLLEKELKKLVKAFPKTFSIDCDDGRYDDCDSYSDSDNEVPDFAACSLDDCGYCGKCMY